MSDKLKIWQCKIGEIEQSKLPSGVDEPMRQAVHEAYMRLTGQYAKFLFSGWGAELTEYERAVVDNVDPDPSEFSDVLPELTELRTTAANQAETIGRLRSTIESQAGGATEYVLAQINERLRAELEFSQGRIDRHRAYIERLRDIVFEMECACTASTRCARCQAYLLGSIEALQPKPEKEGDKLPGPFDCPHIWHRMKCVDEQKCPDCGMTIAAFNQAFRQKEGNSDV